MSLTRLSNALTGPAPIRELNMTEKVDILLSQVEYQGTRLSLRAWAKHTGISEPTLRYRHKRGWSPPQILGYEPPPLRDRASEQSGRHESKVTIVENGEVISRRVAAAILKIEPQSLRRRLKQYRHRGEVSLIELKQSSRRL